jgi:enamine deaminase RidA (YjgF/YER057c/UK114 family)
MSSDDGRRRHASASPFEAQVGFCRAIRVGERVLVSGTAPIGADGTSVPEGAAAQARRCAEIVAEALGALGAELADVVRTRTYLVRREDGPEVARVHGEVFGAARPAATMVVVAGLLDPRWRVEWEVEAVVPPGAGARRSGAASAAPLRVEPLGDADRDWVRGRIAAAWGDETVVTRGVVHRPAELAGLVAWAGGERVGHLTLRFERDECEVVTLAATERGRGVGGALLRRAERLARYARARRLWLVTTNDNLAAQGFYRRAGFVVAAVHADAVAESRRLKPTIPERGEDGVPIRDEIELEKRLEP